MLAIVDNFARAGMLIRRSAAAKIRTPLKERNAKAGFGESASGSEAGQPTAGDRDCGRVCQIR